MIMSALAGMGVFCYTQLPRELFPDVEFPIVTVRTTYVGAGPEEVEQLISKELEDVISTVEGIKHLRSISQQGISLVMAEFYLETNVDVAAADVRAKVDLVRSILPEAADDPVTMKFDFNAQPVMQLAVSAKRPLREIFHTADQRIKDRLSTIPDVASVDIVGGHEREIQVLVKQQRLRSYGLSITDVIGAIAAANLETPGGHISQDNREYNIRMRGKFTSLEQIAELKLMSPAGGTIYLRDVAEVVDTYKEVRTRADADGRPCVGLSIQKRSGGNTVAVCQKIQKEIDRLDEILPGDYKFTVQDEQATWLIESINNVFGDMYVGIILTAAVLFIFLHSLRGVVIVALTMPISVVATFIIMYLMGFTLNLMSLMGLAMTIGVLVDNAILVLENITRHLHLGHSPDEAAIAGTGEIAVAVASTTLTNVVVFVPIAFMGGIVGQFFRDFGLTATFATIVSLFISFTMTPMMAAKLLNKANTTPAEKGLLSHFSQAFDRAFTHLRDSYETVLNWVLNHHVKLLLLVLVLLVASFWLVGYIGSEFITPMDQGKFIVSVEMPVGTHFQQTSDTVAMLENFLTDKKILPELVSLYSSVGSTMGGDIGGASQSVNIAQILVTLTGKGQRSQSTSQIMDRLRPELAGADLPGARIKLLEISGGGGAEASIQIELMGDDPRRINEMAQQLMEIMSDSAKIPGVVDLDTNYRLGQPEVHIVPDKEKCRDNGIDTHYLAQIVAASFEGTIASEYREGAFNYDIRIKADEDSRRTVKDIDELTIMNRTGSLIPVAQVAQIDITTGPAQIFRKNRQSLITVSCDVSGRSEGDVVTDIQKQMEPLQQQYPDVTVFYGGEIERMQESFQRLGVALIMAVALTYMLLGSLLESFIQPLIIMLTLPLSLIGVFLALFLMGGTFSIFSIMSVIMLVGLVINNSIVIIDYINVLRKQGTPRRQAIITAGTTRLRPILMANLTTVVAMIPLALGHGWGGEMRAPMAMVQIGGLIAGGMLGLLIVPVVYTISDDIANKLRHLFTRTD
jgi:HAE1 family hydrophobic/amphiphilic exporter-1